MKEIFINVEDFETSVSIVEEGKLLNFFLEKNTFANTGNVYKGKITKTVSNMNFVFLDIGDKKTGFLSEQEYFDIGYDYGGTVLKDSNSNKKEEVVSTNFEKGQDVIVQVVKEPYKTKGARLTTNITFPGTYIVFAPFIKTLGISRRIEDETERLRLRDIVRKVLENLKDATGVIVRTQAVGAAKEEIEKEIRQFSAIWGKIKEDAKKHKAPKLLYKEQEMPIRVLRENLDESVKTIWVDDKNTYENLKRHISKIYKNKKNIQLKLFEGKENIFTSFGFVQQVENIYKNIVSFKKGGYISVDVTEALTVFDINSGKHKGAENVEESIYQLNLNAAQEVAHQIILRNIGGIIVIDFIDMKELDNRKKLKALMEKELSRSKLSFKIADISEFGLMEITRKRVANRIDDLYFEDCYCCSGRGRLITLEKQCFNKLKEIKYKCKSDPEKNILAVLTKRIKEKLVSEYSDTLAQYERVYRKKIVLELEEE
ncbi:MAG: Rne/Rng family ribonuclease [bacterium]